MDDGVDVPRVLVELLSGCVSALSQKKETTNKINLDLRQEKKTYIKIIF